MANVAELDEEECPPEVVPDLEEEWPEAVTDLEEEWPDAVSDLEKEWPDTLPDLEEEEWPHASAAEAEERQLLKGKMAATTHECV